MADEIAVVRIKADISGLKSGTADVVKELQKIDRQGKLTQDGMGKIDGATTRVKVSLKKMADETAGTKNALSGVEKATDTTNQTLKDLADSAAKTAGGMGKAAGGMSGLLQQFGQSGVVDTMATSMSNASDMVEGVGMLAGLSSPGGAAALAVGAVAGIGTAMFKLRDDMIQADIAKHFGDIQLSAEEVEEAAKRLTTTDWTIQLDTYTNAKEKLEEHEANIRSALEQMNRLDWKISVGMELTEEEKKSYQNAVELYTKECTAFIEQKGYTVSIALQATLSGGTLTRVSEFSNSFYTQSQKEMVDLGEKLAQEVNKEFEQKTFNFDSKAIQDIKQRMRHLKEKLLQDDIEVTVEAMKLSFGSIDISKLSQDSFKKITDTVENNLKEIEDKLRDTRIASVSVLVDEYKANIKAGMPEAIAKKIKEDAEREVELNLARSKGTVIVQGINFSWEGITGAFGTKADQAKASINKDFDGIKTLFLRTFNEFDPKEIETRIMSSYFSADKALVGAASNALEALKPQQKQLESIAKAYLDAGESVPKNIQDGLTKTYELGALSYSTDNMYKLWAKDIANSPEKMQALAEAEKSGAHIPEGVIQAVSMYSGQIYNVTRHMWEQPVIATQDNIEPVRQYLNQSGLDCGNEMAMGLAQSYGLVYDSANQTWATIIEATLNNHDTVKSVLSQCGIDASDGLIEAILQKEEPTRAQVVNLLAQITGATDQERDRIVEELFGLGFLVSGALGNGIYENYDFVQQGSGGMIDVINKTTGAKITTLQSDWATKLKESAGIMIQSADGYFKTHPMHPEVRAMTEEEGKIWAEAELFAMQQGLSQADKEILFKEIKIALSPSYDDPNEPHYRVDRKTGQIVKVGGKANGGLVDREQLTWIAEGNKPEMVIPLSPEKRSRGIGLWEQAGATLGMLPAAGNTYPAQRRYSGGLDYDRLADRVVEALRQTPIEVRPEITVQEGGVYLDTELAGRQLAPVISCKLAKSLY